MQPNLYTPKLPKMQLKYSVLH